MDHFGTNLTVKTGRIRVIYGNPFSTEEFRQKKKRDKKLIKKYRCVIRNFNEIMTLTKLNLESLIRNYENLILADTETMRKSIIKDITEKHSILKNSIKNLDRVQTKLHSLRDKFENFQDDSENFNDKHKICLITKEMSRYKVFLVKILKMTSEFLTSIRNTKSYNGKDITTKSDSLYERLITEEYCLNFLFYVKRRLYV